MLYILEGLDRTGKSSVADLLKKDGYEVIHMSAPSKKYSQPGYTGPSFLDEMVDLISAASSQEIVLDRSYYGEACIWPMIYDRTPLLNEEDLEILREIEEAVGVKRILMIDHNIEKHWKRCVDNNEPLTRVQFSKARKLYQTLVDKYNFEPMTISDFNIVPTVSLESVEPIESAVHAVKEISNLELKTPEQRKLEKANAINDIISKKIIKQKGTYYDQIENDIRQFLNNQLGALLGGNIIEESLSKDDILILKTLIHRLKEKDQK